MSASNTSPRHVERAKIAFHLDRDEDGYPPADWEHLWARVVGDGLYFVDNTPFFAYGISFGDLVEAEEESGQLVYRRSVQLSPHSTLRVVLFRKERTAQIRQALRDLGCATEMSHIPGHIAVDVPPEASLSSVRWFLGAGEEAGDWEYEEAAIREV